MKGNFRSTIAETSYNERLRKYMISVFNKMFLALCLTGIVSFICASSPEILAFMTGGFSIVLMIATFGIVFYLSSQINKISVEKAQGLFWVYASLIGAFLSPVFVMYTGQSIANAFFTTAVFFGGMSLYGYTTKKDLTNVGSFMTVGLFSIIITSLINVIFLKSPAIQIGISALSIIIFSGLTAYDIQKIKELYSDSHDDDTISRIAIFGALRLYLDFINLFLAILRFVGNRK